MNAYIVAFKKPEDHPTATDDHITELSKRVEQQGGEIKHLYNSRTMRGFAASMPDALKDEFEANPAIKYVEADGPVTIQ
ncbi:BQ2448_3007 [Microbotryum intermedium]|uniref:BQ2448_3007 protein n=1 Tax=Microbotryum intermedium TaxID=269621 RepID=A0A238FF36_9BASI|nr:BQ2448_3007 [Microbotryum intermedium]